MASLLLALFQLPLYYFLEVIYFLFRCRPKKQIKDEHVLITGATQGIGAGLADKFAEMGNTVHCVGRNKALLQKKVEDLRAKGLKAYAYTCDISKKKEVEELYEDISGAGYTVTVLINNAGVALGITVGDLTLEQLDQVVTTNLTSNLWLVKLFLPKMLELNKGHVVNMSSAAGIFSIPFATDYCATKAAQIQMTDQLRTEFIKTDVKFTVICPASVKTSMTDKVEHKVRLMTVEFCINECVRGILENKDKILVIKLSAAKIFITVFDWLPPSIRKYVMSKVTEYLKD